MDTPIIIETVNTIPNADVFQGQDSKIFAKISKLEQINNRVVVDYGISTSGEIIRVSRRTFTDQQFNNLFTSTGEEILQGEDFVLELGIIYAEGLRRLVVQEALIPGLGINDWVVISPVRP